LLAPKIAFYASTPLAIDVTNIADVLYMQSHQISDFIKSQFIAHHRSVLWCCWLGLVVEECCHCCFPNFTFMDWPNIG